MSNLGGTPERLTQTDPRLSGVLNLIRTSFAYMEGRIDPPSSMHRLSLDALRDQMQDGEVWVIGDRPDAVVFLTPKPGRLYLSKLAVDQNQRGRGLAHRLVTQAETRAEALGLKVLELQTRVELVENHTAFARMGFVKTGEVAHPGYDRTTSITMQKLLG